MILLFLNRGTIRTFRNRHEPLKGLRSIMPRAKSKGQSAAQDFSQKVRSWRDLAKVIHALPPDVQDGPVMFGDPHGDQRREAFSVNEIAAVTTPDFYFDPSDKPVPTGTLMLF